jgi:hypothetical protein
MYKPSGLAQMPEDATAQVLAIRPVAGASATTSA